MASKGPFTANQQQFGIVIEGLKTTLDLLKAYDPEQGKIINRRMTKAVGVVKKAAQADIPSSNPLRYWGPWTHLRDGRDFSWDSSSVKRNIKVTRRPGRARGAAISNFIALVSKDAVGVIYQTAGRGGSDEFFNQNIVNKFGEKRGIWKAFDEKGDAAITEIEGAAQEAQRLVQDALDRVSGGA